MFQGVCGMTEKVRTMEVQGGNQVHWKQEGR